MLASSGAFRSADIDFVAFCVFVVWHFVITPGLYAATYQHYIAFTCLELTAVIRSTVLRLATLATYVTWQWKPGIILQAVSDWLISYHIVVSKFQASTRRTERSTRPLRRVERDVTTLTSLVIGRRETEAATICRLVALTLCRAGPRLWRDRTRHASYMDI